MEGYFNLLMIQMAKMNKNDVSKIERMHCGIIQRLTIAFCRFLLDTNRCKFDEIFPIILYIMHRYNCSYILLILSNSKKMAHLPQYIDPQQLIRSVIAKMMYTCSNQHCKHRLNSTQNIKATKTSAGSHKRGHHQCGCFAGLGQDNPESPSKQGRATRAYTAYQTPAGNYTRPQSRGRWVNTDFFSGHDAKKLIYQLEGPAARVQHSPSSKNYDTQYRMYEERVRMTPAQSPPAQSRISGLVRKDRSKSK